LTSHYLSPDDHPYAVDAYSEQEEGRRYIDCPECLGIKPEFAEEETILRTFLAIELRNLMDPKPKLKKKNGDENYCVAYVIYAPRPDPRESHWIPALVESGECSPNVDRDQDEV
jgi:hypothetical protein